MAEYGADLAYTHNAGYTRLAEIAADRLLEEVHREGPERGLIVELGCGPGATAAKVLAAGFDVVGIDISPDMLAIARQRAPRATFVEGSFLTAEIPPCDAVIAVGEVFNYMFDKGNTNKALERVFGKIFKALWPGGVLMFDMLGPEALTGAGTFHHAAVGDDWGVLVDGTEDAKKLTISRTITTLRKTASGITQSVEVHKQRLVAPSAVLEMLRKAGFKARSLQGYDGERFRTGHSVFLARRP